MQQGSALRPSCGRAASVLGLHRRLPVDGHLRAPPWAAVSRASVNVCMQRLESQLALLRGVDPEARLLGRMVVLGLLEDLPSRFHAVNEEG